MRTTTQLILKRTIVFFLVVALISTTYLPLVQSPLSPKSAFAAGSCKNGAVNRWASAIGAFVSKVGGVSLDQAATFLANMDDIKGAYYDETSDRIVFVGKTNTSLPEFDKDDLAVAIKAVIFNKTIPAVSIENPNNGMMDVLYYGGIENTRFGDVLVDADYKLKQYVLGYDTNDQPIASSVTGYKSVFQRYLDKNPSSNQSNAGRQWITPKDVILKRDDSTNSFVFDTVTMELEYEPLQVNDPLYDQASEEFAQHHTTYFDDFAAEIPEYKDAKQLGKIVSVIKWLADNGIATDFQWASDYAPKIVQTPTQVPELEVTGITYNGYVDASVSGGVEYLTANSYQTASGAATTIKTASEAVNAPKEDINWTFSSGGQSYEAVAVAADAFRSLGSYNTSVIDMAFDTCGDVDLSFTRSYSSFSGGQFGIGRGWTFAPSTLVDNKPAAAGRTVEICEDENIPASEYYHRKYLAFQSRNGERETFTYDGVTCQYLPDDNAYHSKITDNRINSNRTLYAVKTKDQKKHVFEELWGIEGAFTDYAFRLTSVEDKTGTKVNYSYNSQNRLIHIADDRDHGISPSYNNAGLISKITDWNNREVNYTYDAQGNLLTVTDPRGYVTTYTYDSNNKLATITDRENTVVLTNTYNTEAKIATQKSAANVTDTYTYDDANKKVTKSDGVRTEETTYDSKARILTQKDPLNKTITYTYGAEFAPLTVTDKNNKTTTNTYDLRGNLETVTDPNNKTITYDYDNEDRLIEISDGRYTPAKITENTYDGSGNLTEVDEDGKVSTFTYDQYGEMLTKTDAENRTTTWTRDTFGNPLTEKDEYDNTTEYAYDVHGWLSGVTDPENREISYTYDNNGNKLTETNALGTMTYEYNKENNVKKFIAPHSPVTQFTYNTSQQIASVIDPLSNTTTYTRDGYQNMTAKQDALNRTTEYLYDKLNRRTEIETPLGKVTEWAYDPNGNLISRIDANNQETTYTYDSLNRLTKITYPGNTDVDYTYDARGNVLTTVDTTGTTTYTYDKFDRLTQVTDSNSNVVSYEYDEVDNLTQITYPGNKEVNYAYDDANRLITVTDWNNKQVAYTYYANDLIETRTLPNGVVTTYVYDNANKLASIEHEKGQNLLAKYTYQRNSAGNITKVTEEPFTGSEPEEEGEINIAPQGTGYRWSQNTSATSDSNKVAAAGINDGNMTTDVELNGGSDDNADAWEGAGVTWSTAQDNITSIEYKNGSWVQEEDGNGVFTANFKLQFTTDGTTWTDSGWSSSPAYAHDSSNAGGATYTFTGNTSGIRGARVVGQVRTSGAASWHAHAVELKVMKDTDIITNIAPSGTAYRWSQNASASADANKVAASGLNDNNTTTDVDLNNGSDDNENAWEGAGVTWGTTQNNITSVDYINGSWTQDNNGAFTQNFKLQFTTDGTTWTDSGWTSDPAYDYDSSASVGKTYTFSGSNTSVRGARVVGQVRTPDDDSWRAIAREVRVFTTTVATGSGNIALSGTGYRWHGNTSATSDSNKDAETEINDGNKANEVSLTTSGADDIENGWEAAGVTWGQTQNGVTTVKFKNGSWTGSNNGAFTANVKLQFTTDGTTWTDSGWTISPNYNYDSQTAGGKTYLFMGAPTNIRGARIAGQVRTPNANSWYANASEVEVFTGAQPTLTGDTFFTYDALDRLLSTSYTNDAFEYTYNSVGSILTSKKNGTQSTYTYNNDNQLTQKDSTTYVFDNRGDQVERGDKDLTYSFDHELLAFTDPNGPDKSFIYDGKGNRIEEKTNGTPSMEYVNDVSGDLTNVLIAKNLSTSSDSYYVYGTGLLSQGGVNEGDREYYLEDGQGNIRLVTDSSGDSLGEYQYDAYGNQLEGNTEAEFKYKGESVDSTTGLYFMRARYYNPTTGSFVSKDPSEGAVKNPKTQNGYNFLDADPINHIDPSGLWTADLGLSVGTGGGGLVTGLQVSQDGIFSYGGGGVATPGPGASVSFDPKNDPETGLSVVKNSGAIVGVQQTTSYTSGKTTHQAILTTPGSGAYDVMTYAFLCF